MVVREKKTEKRCFFFLVVVCGVMWCRKPLEWDER
jgi:hypothetical protein